MSNYYALHGAGPSTYATYDDDWLDEPFPFQSLAQDEFTTIRTTPRPSRGVVRERSVAHSRRAARAGSPGLLSTPTKKVGKRPKQHQRRRLRSQSPSPSPTRERYPYPYLPLLPPLPYAQQQPYYAPRQRKPLPPPTPQYAPPPARQFSLLSLFRPSFSLVLLVAFGSIAIVALSTTLQPITQGIGNVVNAFSRINPAEVVGAIFNPIANIPVTDVWCKAIGFGCGPDRHAAFRTEKFWSLNRPHHTQDISIGTDFFDCLDDLRITRQQEVATSHFLTLAGKVMQFEHSLAAPEELRDNLYLLAETLEDFLYHANTARMSGSKGVGKIILEYRRFRDRSSSLTPSDISEGLLPAREDLASSAAFTISSAQAVQKAKETLKLVQQQAHSEISRLLNIQNNEESGLKYLAYGWTEPSWKLLQPGLVGKKEQRREAALFLNEVVRVIDESAMPMIRNALSLQQCAINTNDFSYQIERDFSLLEPSWTLSIDGQLRNLAPQIESLDSRLGQLKKKNEAARLALAQTDSPSLPPAPSAPSIEEGHGEELRKIDLAS